MNNGNINNHNKANAYRARAVARVEPSSATPRGVYDIPFSTIIEAWIDCERNKRSSNSCTRFRWHAARDLVALWCQMREGRYEPLTSMCFMVTVPVLREVWAAAFRDRVAHHWENLRFGPVIERFFVDVGDCSMNCRSGYGSLRAVKTMQTAIHDFTEGHTRDDCYIVGGDFSNFFMSVDKPLLWGFLEHIIMDEYVGGDKSALLYMMKTTLFHRCQDRFYRRSHVSMWDGLPPRKSLFHMDGMPIGNLPSQIWANFLGAIFTMWMVHVKKIDGFVIFVDDWRCLVRSREEGRRLIGEIKAYLADELHITLHPDKIYLQHYSKGTKMVGAVIKPPSPRGSSSGRVYIANRTRGHFISAMIAFNREGDTHRARVAMLGRLRATVNSYLGLMSHFNSFKVRRKICERYILPVWGKYLYFEDEFRKCVIRREYDRIHIVRKKLKNRKYAAKFIRPKWSGNEESN